MQEKRLELRLTQDLYDRAFRHAQQRDMSFGGHIRDLLEEYERRLHEKRIGDMTPAEFMKMMQDHAITTSLDQVRKVNERLASAIERTTPSR